MTQKTSLLKIAQLVKTINNISTELKQLNETLKQEEENMKRLEEEIIKHAEENNVFLDKDSDSK